MIQILIKSDLIQNKLDPDKKYLYFDLQSKLWCIVESGIIISKPDFKACFDYLLLNYRKVE